MIRRRIFSRSVWIVGAAATAALAGCQVAPPAPQLPAPQLQLLDSQPLVLAEDCTISGSVFVEFTVRTDGRTDEVKMPTVPACVHDALTAWVGSFRYSPQPSAIPAGVEWMLVSALKGS